MILYYNEDEAVLDDVENQTTSCGYGLKEYLAEEAAYTKFITELIKQYDNGK